ncbi:hypothetical protein BANRA_05467 [Klebsiella pneumoniae]|nr:hypothetical protein BANRA_05467 [Klebsiella pneumoniae]
MSNEKRKTIGRQLNTQASMLEMADTGRSQVFTLKTGRKVTFRFVRGHCCKVSDEAAFCLIQRPYISKTLLTRRISPRGSP